MKHLSSINLKSFIITCLLLHFFFLANAQEVKSVQFDRASFDLRDSIPENLSMNQVILQINRLCSTDAEKLSLVAGWMFKNISFDLQKFARGGGIPDYRTVFASKKGICGDYASLFHHFCRQLHIKCEIIEGYVPEFGVESRNYVETNHAWNLVRIGNEWYHFDLLGFSGVLTQASSSGYQFIKQPDPTKIFTTELSFIAEHIPADPIWQLSDYPIPMDTLLKNGSHSRIDSASARQNYKEKIDQYLKMSAVQKQLAFADNAYTYNPHNCNAIVVNYYNASVDLINSGKGDRNKLLKARKYLNRARQFVGKASNGVEKLKPEIDESLLIINKYLK